MIRLFFFLVLILRGDLFCRSQTLGSKKRVLFLHIGKAGGGTITDIIKFNNLEDEVDIWHPQGVLTEQLFLSYDHILINVRDPVKRAISAINYECLTTEYRLNGTSVGCCPKQDTAKLVQSCEKRAAIMDYFKGSSNLIGEALVGNNDADREKAESLMEQFVHTKMSIATHVGGVKVLQQLVEHKVSIYVTVLDDDFIGQILYQLERIVTSIAKTKQQGVLARNLRVPKMHNLHKSFANYSITSDRAQHSFSSRYAEDYEVIQYLGEIGCGQSGPCKEGVKKIVENGIALGDL